MSVAKKAGHYNQNRLQYIDPNVEPEIAIAQIQLPQQTIYLIDKVVRAKAMQGPIGVDNSEVINLKMEQELKRRTKNLANHNAAQTDDDEDSDGLNEEEREHLNNEKLLSRLYKAADIEHDAKVRFDEAEGSGAENVMDQQNRALIQQSKDHKRKITHEEWIRCKEHQASLREVLLHEAKRDLYEKLLAAQAKQDEKNQLRARTMFEWEERKMLRQHLDREEELKRKEHERLKKITKKEKCYHAYKEWLKKSLIKQRQELDEKKIENYQRREQEELERREKENLKVKAKIAYKEWRERKNEEARHKRKVERMEKRRQEMEE